MGSAIECFDDSGAVVVPRERFAPVKTTNDLFSLRSDAFKVNLSHTLQSQCMPQEQGRAADGACTVAGRAGHALFKPVEGQCITMMHYSQHGWSHHCGQRRSVHATHKQGEERLGVYKAGLGGTSTFGTKWLGCDKNCSCQTG